MSLSFILRSFYFFSNHSFAICGKTISSLNRNIITALITNLRELGFSVTQSVSKNYIDISLNNISNRFYLFGGKDEASASLIQGITLAGVLFDEVALMPRSFVEQAIARCSVNNSTFWFNCNPEHPYHWFYREWIKKASQKNILYISFQMSDNPSLSPSILKRYASLYSGAFHDRFVKGIWTVTSGLVYDMFDHTIHTFNHEIINPENYFLSCDYGTTNPFSLGLWAKKNNKFYRINEFYFDSKKQKHKLTDDEYLSKTLELIDGKKISAIVIDPSAASFIECIKRKTNLRIIKANNDVSYGIRKVGSAIKSGLISFSSDCKDSIREFSLYSWNENTSDSVKKEFDHAMDDIRYFVTTIIPLYSNNHAPPIAGCLQRSK